MRDPDPALRNDPAPPPQGGNEVAGPFPEAANHQANGNAAEGRVEPQEVMGQTDLLLKLQNAVEDQRALLTNNQNVSERKMNQMLNEQYYLKRMVSRVIAIAESWS